ncbi:hypothetical protein F4802DRAFT_49604 [Xylaria palmicola]|nr:hypothetical protein F4802DRAFT_49604 [Xylaria palmicola]
MRQMSPRPYQACKSLTGRLVPRRGVTPVSRASYHDDCPVQPVTTTQGSIDVDTFRELAGELAGELAVPVHLRDFHRLPAMERWFTGSRPERGPAMLGHRLSSFPNTIVSYELIVSPESPPEPQEAGPSACSSDSLRRFQAWLQSRPAEKDSKILCTFVDHLLEANRNNQSRFLHFDGPLSLMIQASRYNEGTECLSRRIKQLYIAQSDIRSLPPPLAEDLPVPELVPRVGKGDIYGSSVWLGLQPTYTPLHRDPNPNLFCQLVGSKAVRLLRPGAGQSVFQDVRRRLGAAGNSRFRGPEMMDGPERDGLHHAVWVHPDTPKGIWQATLGPGDALFIPQGWWHSVRSVGREAELNASANWWFR